ncbi:hypothetical protein DFJ73DRAFT_805461 [Zopfochytrium polystomum]|nr:hypothetical protein DFJ73DRAFT_805461 [Zopfochytrium polystomum]
MAGAALESVRFAQSCGQVDVLEWWRTSGFMVWTWSSGLRSASEDGHVSVLEWWKSLGMPLMWDAVSCVNVAARSGRVEVLEWWRTSGIPVNWTDTAVLSYASENGHLTVLEWWKRHEFLSPRKDVVQSGIENALRCGSVPALEFWREYAPDAFAANCVSTLAVEKGHVEVLEWLKLSGYQISSSSPGIAALHDQAAVLEWLRNSGLQMDWDMNRLRSTLLHRRQALKWFQAEVASALRNAYIWILDYAMDCKPNKMLRTWRDEWLEDAAGAGNLSVFEWRLRRIWKRKPFTAVPEAVLCSASTRGRVEILQWLKDHNILMSCTQAVIHAACAGKSVAVLQRWKEYCDTFSFSSEFVLGHSIGDVDLLEWWRRSGFELDWPSSVSMHRVCCNSPRSRLADVLQWWTETGAAFDDVAKATAYLMARDDVATLEWMESIAMSVAPPRGVEGRNLSRWWEEYRECQR